MDGLAIRVRNLGKVYRIYDRPEDRLKQMAFARFGKSYGREFWALRDISFELRRGEALGIIGRNGSGKSTLLQMIAGTTTPTTGFVETQGRLACLLELGSGFNPEFTGRENVYMNGALLGLSQREIRQNYEEIVDFADIGEFIDQPVKFYSSGMFVRLAFAVQACIKPDILIVDEALAVGDIGFQRKCYRFIQTLKREHRTTIILVTHDVHAVVNFCDSAMLLTAGRLSHQGASKLIVELFQKQIFGEDIQSTSVERYGDGNAAYRRIWFETTDHQEISSVAIDQDFLFCQEIDFAIDIDEPVFGIRITDLAGHVLVSTNTHFLNTHSVKAKRGDRVILSWKIKNSLNLGTYFFTCGCSYPQENRFLCRVVDGVRLPVLGVSREVGMIRTVEDVSLELIDRHLSPNHK